MWRANPLNATDDSLLLELQHTKYLGQVSNSFTNRSEGLFVSFVSYWYPQDSGERGNPSDCTQGKAILSASR